MAKQRKKQKRFHSGDYISTKTGKTWHHRSGWELKFMCFLDNDHSVKTWTYETITIEYVSNKKTGRVRKYIPDFFIEYIDGSKKIIEIKQARMLKRRNVIDKTDAAKKWCERMGMTICVLTEHELKKLHIIK